MTDTTTPSRTGYPRILDEVNVRLVAGEVLVVSIVAAATQQLWLYIPLAIDFALRATVGPKVSPLALLVAKAIRPGIKAAPRPTPAPPKRFAASVGTVFAAAISVVGFTGPSLLAWLLVAVMIVFPILESVFAVCVGCQVFALLMRLGVIPESVCLECADITLRQKRLAALP